MKKQIISAICLLALAAGVSILISIIACGCKNSRATGDREVCRITVNPDENVPVLDVNDIAVSMTGLLLMEDPSYPIGEIWSVKKYRDDFILFDPFKAKSVQIYDSRGRLKSVIDRLGHGEGEYTQISDVDVDEKTGQIVILDGNKRVLLYYDMGGKYVKTLDLKNHGFVYDHFILSEGRAILDQGNDNRGRTYLKVVNDRGAIVADMIAIPEWLKGVTISPRCPLQRTGQGVFYMPGVTPVIYQLTDTLVTPVYEIDFKSGWPSESYFREKRGTHPLSLAQSMSSRDGKVCFLNFLNGKNVLYLDFEYKGEVFCLFYNKETGQRKYFHPRDDHSGGLLPVGVDGDTFIYVKRTKDDIPGFLFLDLDWGF